MKFDREELLSVLSDAGPALAKSNVIPGLDHFWFDGKYLYAYNGGLGVRTQFKSDLDCGLPGKALLDLLRTSALKEVDLSDDKKGIALKMGKSHVNLVSLQGDLNPWAFPSAKKDTPTLTLSEEVLEAFTRVSFLRRGGKATQVVHHGVTVIPDKSTVDFYSTDSLSMARFTIKLKADKALEKFIAPWEFVDRFLALSAPGAVMSILEDCLLVEGDGVLVCSNVLELPDHPDLPGTLEEFVTDDPEVELPPGMQSVLDRAAILSGDNEAPVLISTEGKFLILEGKYGLGSLDEELPIKVSLEKSSASYAANLVRRGLSTAKSISLTPRAMVLRDGEDFIYLVSATEKPQAKKSQPRRKLSEGAE